MYTVTRQIEIDAAHRIPDHRSKCKSLHGHRYRILATCKGLLYAEGEQKGMVLDFGFLKEFMMSEIHEPCDHGTILSIDDPYTNDFVKGQKNVHAVRDTIMSSGYASIEDSKYGKLYVMAKVPTAENLAEHWFDRIGSCMTHRVDFTSPLISVRVYETPNCYAEFSPWLP